MTHMLQGGIIMEDVISKETLNRKRNYRIILIVGLLSTLIGLFGMVFYEINQNADYRFLMEVLFISLYMLGIIYLYMIYDFRIAYHNILLGVSLVAIFIIGLKFKNLSFMMGITFLIGIFTVIFQNLLLTLAIEIIIIAATYIIGGLIGIKLGYKDLYIPIFISEFIGVLILYFIGRVLYLVSFDQHIKTENLLLKERVRYIWNDETSKKKFKNYVFCSYLIIYLIIYGSRWVYDSEMPQEFVNILLLMIIAVFQIDLELILSEIWENLKNCFLFLVQLFKSKKENQHELDRINQTHKRSTKK